MEALNPERPKAQYPCPQKDLYTIVAAGWASYNSYLPVFVAFKTTYDAQLATDQLAALQAVRLLPDETTRADVQRSLRLEMLPLGRDCLALFSNLGSYIRDAFPASQYESKRLASGSDYFPSALREDWDSMNEMMSKAVTFVNLHAAELTTPGGMPATFEQSLIDAQVAFEAKYMMFLNAEEIARVQTDAKVEANNALYKALMKMFEDGKKAFREQPAIRDQFVFDHLWTMIGKNQGGENVITISGIAVLLPSGEPGVGVSITLTNGEEVEEVLTDEAGNYIMEVDDVEEDTEVIMTATIAGREPVTVAVVLHPGEDVVQSFALEPIVLPPPTT